MKRIILALVAVLLLAPSALAQTQTAKLQWSHLGTTVTEVNTYTFILKMDTFNPAIVPATCVQTGPNVDCTTPVVIALNQNHTVILSAANGAGTSTATLNYVPPPTPIPPGQIKVVITITVP